MTEAPVIEKGVALWSRKGPRTPVARSLVSLKKGESFVTAMQRESIYSIAHYYGIKIAIRTDDGKIRVWRIE